LSAGNSNVEEIRDIYEDMEQKLAAEGMSEDFVRDQLNYEFKKAGMASDAPALVELGQSGYDAAKQDMAEALRETREESGDAIGISRDKRRFYGMSEETLKKEATEHANGVRKGMSKFLGRFGIGAAAGFSSFEDAAGKDGSNLKGIAKWLAAHRESPDAERLFGQIQSYAQQRLKEIRQRVLRDGAYKLTEAERQEVLILMNIGFLMSLSAGKGFTFRNEQLLAGALSGEQFAVLNVGTGEGKTKISALALTFQYLVSNQDTPVMQLVTTDTFAKDNLAEIKPLIDWMGIRNNV